MKIYNAENMIAGRLATFVAKDALLGEEIAVVNSDKAVMSGDKKFILDRYKERATRGRPTKGPFYRKSSDRFLKRIIRGMLPYKQAKGEAALKRIKCYVGVPPEFEGKEMIAVEKANVDKLPNFRYITMKEICKSLGGKE